MLIARRDFRFSFEAIGFFFGGRDHATVMSNVASMDNRLRFDEELRAARMHICGELHRAGVTPHADR
jgi:chromosomal replication initiation ATPase DnaA